MYRSKTKVSKSKKLDKSKKIKSSVQFYVGTKRWECREQEMLTDKLLDYVNYCFSLIYNVLAKRKCISLLNTPYEIILQFMCGIMNYNGLFYRFVHLRSHTNADNINTLKYKVIEDADLYLAECVFYNETEEIFYFNDRLIKLCLSFAHQKISLEFPPDLMAHRVTFQYDVNQKDLVSIDPSITPELCMLFMIAEHAVLHLPQKNPDYISHEKLSRSPLFMFHTIMNFKMVGDIESLLHDKLKGDDYILAL